MSYRKKHIKNRIRRFRPKKPFYKKPVFFIPALLLILGAIFYFILFYSKFEISNMVILGNSKVEKEEIEKIASDRIKKQIMGLGSWKLVSKSIFLANSKAIADDILGKIPKIGEVKISKKLPSTIQVEVKEREASVVFCKNNREECFYADKSGIAFENLWGNPYNDMILIESSDNDKISLGKAVVKEDIVELVLKIKSDLENKFGIKVKKAVIFDDSRLNIETSENWQAYFNLDSDRDLQVAKLNILLKDEIPEDTRKTLQYIDLRFRDRAYYK